jgi:hypothetical protein
MRANNRLNAQKKAKTTLQRQKEAWIKTAKQLNDGVKFKKTFLCYL